MAKKKLLEFYGTECRFCNKMKPLVEKLEKETSIKIDKIEVWHNAKNAEIKKKYDKDYCNGVPFFINTTTGRWICGAAPYNKLKNWAKGK